MRPCAVSGNEEACRSGSPHHQVGPPTTPHPPLLFARPPPCCVCSSVVCAALAIKTQLLPVRHTSFYAGGVIMCSHAAGQHRVHRVGFHTLLNRSSRCIKAQMNRTRGEQRQRSKGLGFHASLFPFLYVFFCYHGISVHM